MKKLLLTLSSIFLIQSASIGVVSCSSSGGSSVWSYGIGDKNSELNALEGYISSYNRIKDRKKVEEIVYQYFTRNQFFTFDKNFLPSQKGYYVKFEFLDDDMKNYNFKVTLTDIIKVNEEDDFNYETVIDESSRLSRDFKISKSDDTKYQIALDKYIYNIADEKLEEKNPMIKLHISNYTKDDTYYISSNANDGPSSPFIDDYDFDKSDKSYIIIKFRNLNLPDIDDVLNVQFTVTSEYGKPAVALIYKRTVNKDAVNKI
ncbi:hypothetical protein SHELI_v1c04030 [Spiroplasma helicoides]|uniref:Lipoprotein n=1 Tax=Spiroplasma helicoides TaxID=216938 RepID=A0A1B3SK93_9MOLU|nr:hypothetical protein [Spiroplasma helicoides]AOG60354.1 hypothetical protein SHELI_v1c04030 [Spiroplasma helicoides]